jgi:hypothetical protein
MKWEQDRGDMAKSRFGSKGPQKVGGRSASARGGQK